MHGTRRTSSWLFALPVLATLLTQPSALGQSAAQAPTQQPDRAATPSYAASRTPGFLEPHERPDSLQLVPPPPRKGTAAYAADVESYRAMRSLRDTRALASGDRRRRRRVPTRGLDVRLCARHRGDGVDHAEPVPAAAALDGRCGAIDAARQGRIRAPATVRGVTTTACACPTTTAALRKSGAYPSGHAAAGWAWALILAEIAPDRAGPILRRGYEFGISRVVCGVHWMSDVETGRTVGAAAVARLHADAEFVAQLALARDEVARMRREHGAPDDADCAAEARALAVAASR